MSCGIFKHDELQNVSLALVVVVRVHMLHRCLMTSCTFLQIRVHRTSSRDPSFSCNPVNMMIAMLVDNQLMSALVNVQIFSIDRDLVSKKLRHLFEWDVLRLGQEPPNQNRP